MPMKTLENKPYWKIIVGWDAFILIPCSVKTLEEALREAIPVKDSYGKALTQCTFKDIPISFEVIWPDEITKRQAEDLLLKKEEWNNES